MTVRVPKSSRSATIYDVAEVAGVSHQTVSRVLKGVTGIRPETREKVEAALAELRYRPNVVARELASPRPSRIGVVGYETFESSTSKVLRGVNEVALESGYVLDIVTVDPLGDVEEIARRLDAINGSDVAGLLASGADVVRRSEPRTASPGRRPLAVRGRSRRLRRQVRRLRRERHRLRRPGSAAEPLWPWARPPA